MNMNLIESPSISPSLHPSVCLSPLWPASALTREPYAYAFKAILNNLAGDAELFLSEWIQCVPKKKKRERNEQHVILAHYSENAFQHIMLSQVWKSEEKLFVIDTLGNIFFSFYLASQ